jgi:endonuclease YncB( thermonuclease family)
LREHRPTVGALRRSAFFVSALLLAVSCAAAHADSETARVARAYDGDSLWLVDGREVRLIGVNAPELGRDGAPDQPLAAAARNRTDRLVRGKTVQLRYDVERADHYGRTLAYVVLPDGRDLQQLLVREGLAWFIAVAPNVARRDVYRAAEAEARAARRGLWSRAEYRPVPAEELARGQTGFSRVVGTIRRIDDHGEWAVLHLAPGVELTLPRSAAVPDAAAFKGKRVVARGWLTAHENGLRMRITDSTMLEVLP